MHVGSDSPPEHRPGSTGDVWMMDMLPVRQLTRRAYHAVRMHRTENVLRSVLTNKRKRDNVRV